jgi:hypothetical protein
MPVPAFRSRAEGSRWIPGAALPGERPLYKLQCFQATHGSSLRSVELARGLIAGGKMPLLGRMEGEGEHFPPSRLGEALKRASGRNSLKVVVDWENE